MHGHMARAVQGLRVVQAHAQVADQPYQPHDLPVQAQRHAVVHGQHAVLHGLDLGAHGGQGRAQLMRHVGQPALARGLHGGQLHGHVVEGFRKAGQLRIALDGHARIQPPGRNAAQAVDEGGQRLQPAPREPGRQQQRQQQAGQPGPGHKTHLLREEGAVQVALHALPCLHGGQHDLANGLPVGGAQNAVRHTGLRRHAGDELALGIQQAHARPRAAERAVWRRAWAVWAVCTVGAI